MALQLMPAGINPSPPVVTSNPSTAEPRWPLCLAALLPRVTALPLGYAMTTVMEPPSRGVAA